eukprot:13153664-Alexandrium_andersonii.AAC.1
MSSLERSPADTCGYGMCGSNSVPPDGTSFVATGAVDGAGCPGGWCGVVRANGSGVAGVGGAGAGGGGGGGTAG